MRTITLLLVAWHGVLSSRLYAEELPKTEQLQIGMAESMFPGLPKAIRGFVADPFVRLLKTNTGYNGQLHYHEDALKLADDLDKGKVQMGVFYAHEFGWVRAKYPNLEPLVVAEPLSPFQTVCLISQNSKATSLGDLAGEKLSLPLVHRAFSVMFLARQKRDEMKGADFKETIVAPSSVDAIFNTLDGKSGCTVVDADGLRFFKNAYPGPFQRVKVLCTSEVFAGPCIVVKKNTLDPKAQKVLCDTLLKVEKLPGTQMLLDIWRIKGFIEPPNTYGEDCEQIGKKYPFSLTEK